MSTPSASLGAIAYFLLLSLHLSVAWIGNQPAILLSKLLLMPVLLLVVWLRDARIQPLYVGALLGSWLGDGLMYWCADGLDTSRQYAFWLGMLMFVAAHFGYITLLLQQGTRLASKPVLLATGALVFGVLLFDFGLGVKLGYAVSLGVLVYLAAQIDRSAYSSDTYAALNARWILPGALAFVASDALIGLGTAGFVLDTPWPPSLPIMLLYGLAQWGLSGLTVRAPLPLKPRLHALV